MSTYILYGITIILLSVSFIKDKKKTKMALKKAWRSFENIMPQFLVVILFVGILLTYLNPETISLIIGAQSGMIGVILASMVGAVTLIPGFIAFPTAALLLENGAGYMQIAAFISSLMMVGVVTIPVEMKYFGKKMTLFRNGFAFIFSFVVAYIIGLVMM